MKKVFLITFALGLVAFFACTKDDNSGTKDLVALHIRLTDGPGDYQQVNVDIKEVRIKAANDTSQWVSLNTNAGIYNLLDFQNGVDTLLATGMVPADVLKEVRFILGPDNSVMVDSIVYPLQTPSAQQSGLKIKIDKSLNLDINTLTLDFDAEQSVVKTGNGGFILKPVIKVKN
ncbi:MAG: DUF4382 domain-containing protein [Saprospiraceae bacterium]|nr:DUF4382 domain-containing protein [Saprospiraceae bacterium]